MMPPASDLVTVSVTVSTDPATAFAIFTKETDLWGFRRTESSGVRFRRLDYINIPAKSV